MNAVSVIALDTRPCTAHVRLRRPHPSIGRTYAERSSERVRAGALAVFVLIVSGLLGINDARAGVLAEIPARGVDRPGGDYRNFDLTRANPASCQSRCKGDSRCRAWTYVKPGVQGERARCWLKSSVPRPRNASCCTSGFVNVISSIGTCRKIGNVSGSGPVTCIDENGRNHGKAGRAYRPGDDVFVLVRMRRLDGDRKTLRAVYSRRQNGAWRNFSGNSRKLEFSNGSSNWAYWFKAPFRDVGQWRVQVALSGKNLTGQVLGNATYQVGGALD